MVNDRELAKIVARDIFETLDYGDDKCQRIEGKGGIYRTAETSLGGLSEDSLADVIERSLAQNRSY